MSDFVYAIQNTATGEVKIGITASPSHRVKSLQTGSSAPLNILHSREAFDARSAEKLLHEKYAVYRTHLEWFSLPPQIVERLDADIQEAVDQGLAGNPMISTTEQRIRQDLEQARTEQGLTHAALAAKLGIKPPSVTAILTRKRGLIPQSFLDLIEELGLEVVVQPKRQP